MFEKLFGNEKTQPRKRAALDQKPMFAPNTKIAYKPNLINVLQTEHRSLLDLFEKATMTAHAGMQQKSKAFFTEFKDKFVDHVLKENTSLYIFLQHSAKPGAAQKSISSAKHEMDLIAREIMQFLDYCIDDSTEFGSEFLERLNVVDKKLKKRIIDEESLIYPNYKKAGR